MEKQGKKRIKIAVLGELKNFWQIFFDSGGKMLEKSSGEM